MCCARPMERPSGRKRGHSWAVQLGGVVWGSLHQSHDADCRINDTVLCTVWHRGQRLSGQAVVGPCLQHNGWKVKLKRVYWTAQNTMWNTRIQQHKIQMGNTRIQQQKTTKWNTKIQQHKTRSETRMQQHKIQRETQESNSTKHEVKHKNPAAQKTMWNRRIQHDKTQCETRKHNVKHENPTIQNI